MRFCGEKFSIDMHNYLIYKEKETEKYVWLRTIGSDWGSPGKNHKTIDKWNDLL